MLTLALLTHSSHQDFSTSYHLAITYWNKDLLGWICLVHCPYMPRKMIWLQVRDSAVEVWSRTSYSENTLMLKSNLAIETFNITCVVWSPPSKLRFVTSYCVAGTQSLQLSQGVYWCFHSIYMFFTDKLLCGLLDQGIPFSRPTIWDLPYTKVLP